VISSRGCSIQFNIDRSSRSFRLDRL
jgi:hypothetical protein